MKENTRKERVSPGTWDLRGETLRVFRELWEEEQQGRRGPREEERSGRPTGPRRRR